MIWKWPTPSISTCATTRLRHWCGSEKPECIPFLAFICWCSQSHVTFHFPRTNRSLKSRLRTPEGPRIFQRWWSPVDSSFQTLKESGKPSQPSRRICSSILSTTRARSFGWKAARYGSDAYSERSSSGCPLLRFSYFSAYRDPDANLQPHWSSSMFVSSPFPFPFPFPFLSTSSSLFLYQPSISPPSQKRPSYPPSTPPRKLNLLQSQRSTFSSSYAFYNTHVHGPFFFC